MDPQGSDQLTSRQCEQIMAALDGQAAYLGRLLERMGRLGWQHSDQLYRDTVNVLRAVTVMRLTLERLATFQAAFNEGPAAPAATAAVEYVIDPTKRPWEAGYRTPKT